ncbi:hypothetical protein EV191_11591 [Tamaricihabitans halophyticus]|uniref:Uncharacterized protein n=1 Tax=Tamaricihabitans halophyticus TaxID=1262583 RepID=A0A4R2QFH6_9PSEU|nr:hypothetical protein [Tamaricihabitans halophyticus]TCP45811.1 hypothetical protein EV191_11591 [Tamaricihabitans halophyticus]
MTNRSRDDEHRKRLRPFRRHHAVYRQLYTTIVTSQDNGTTRYTVEYDAARDDGHIVLYADEYQLATAEPPASFPVPGGVIDVNVSLYGVTRVHLLGDDGHQRRLTPVAGTLEDLRWRLHRQRPGLSALLAWLAITALLANLVLSVPQAIELLTTVPRIRDIVGGTFTSPVQLPGWLTVIVTLTGALAAVERLLMLRRNRVLDIETLWTNL